MEYRFPVVRHRPASADFCLRFSLQLSAWGEPSQFDLNSRHLLEEYMGGKRLSLHRALAITERRPLYLD